MYKLFVVIGILFLYSCHNSKTSMNKAEYQGDDISQKSSIVTDTTDQSTYLSIDIPGEWVLYAGKSVNSINFSKPVATGKGSGKYRIALPDKERYYFQLVTPQGNAILAEKHLPLKGAYNFRDMGGIRNKDGRYTKWGLIFRADDLGNLTEEDKEYLESIPIRTVVDFRSQQEFENLPDNLPSSVENHYNFDINPGNLAAAVDEKNITVDYLDSLMMDIYKKLVTEPLSIQKYRSLFSLIQNDNYIPLVYHCSAGKDRTGLASALFLYALGVDEDTIMRDYLASNQFLEEKYAPYVQQKPELRVLFEVKQEYLNSSLDIIKENYGSIEDFLAVILNVNLERMKEKYLY